MDIQAVQVILIALRLMDKSFQHRFDMVVVFLDSCRMQIGCTQLRAAVVIGPIGSQQHDARRAEQREQEAHGQYDGCGDPRREVILQLFHFVVPPFCIPCPTRP